MYDERLGRSTLNEQPATVTSPQTNTAQILTRPSRVCVKAALSRDQTNCIAATGFGPPSLEQADMKLHKERELIPTVQSAERYSVHDIHNLPRPPISINKKSRTVTSKYNRVSASPCNNVLAATATRDDPTYTSVLEAQTHRVSRT